MKILRHHMIVCLSLFWFILISFVSSGKIESNQSGFDEIITSTELINFGLVDVNDQSSRSFIIYNLSLIDTVNFTITSNQNSVFSVVPNSGFILPNDSISITAVFEPENSIGYSDSVLIESEDSTIIISLFGAGGKVIESVNPKPNEIGIARNSKIEINFGFKPDPLSLSDNSIKVIGNYRAQYYSEIFFYDSLSRSLIYKPNRDFLAGELITVIITNKVEFDFNQSIIKSFSWRFRADVDSSTGSFSIVNYISAGVNPWNVVVADLDEDDDLDFVVNNNKEAPGLLTIIKHDSSGVLRKDSSYVTSEFTWSPTAFDFDNDNKIDIGVNGNDFEPITMLRNVGNGKFAYHEYIPTYNGNLAINYGDWNGDGNLDLAKVEIFPPERVEFWLNNGEGRFDNHSFGQVGTIAYFIEVNDFDNDGDMDVVCINTNSLTISISVLLNDGSGNFSSNEIPGLGVGAVAMTSGDWDADGDVDLSIVHLYDPGMVSIWLNDGKAFFINTEIIEVGVASKYITSGDWDGDNDLDLATANGNNQENTVSILENDGDGNFSEKARHPAGVMPNSVASGDLDNDGDLDLAVVTSGSLVRLLNKDLPNSVETENELLPDKFVLYQNYPNPFNPLTKIKFIIPSVKTTRRVVFTTLKVYDILGYEIARLVSEDKQPGVYEVEFNASELTSGIYFYRLRVGQFVETKKMILLK